MSTFLQLVQELVTELGIGGANQGATVPSTVTGQVGQLWNAQNWIIKANNNLQLMHTDWEFLAVEYSESLSIGSTSVPTHGGSEVVKMWDRGAFWIDRTTSRAAPLVWQDWEVFRRNTLPGDAVVVVDTKPTLISKVRSSGVLILDSPVDRSYQLTGEFYKVPKLLAVDADVSDIPVEYHRLIICEAAIKYGNKEAAPEIINGMEAEYEFLLEKMRGSQLIGGEYDIQHSQDLNIVIGIPGFDETDDRGTKWWL